MAFDNPYVVIILLLFLLLLAAGLASFLLVRSWRTKTRRDLSRSQKDLRRLRNEFNLIQADLENFSDQEPEPYGSQVITMRGQLADASARIKNLERSYVSLNERIRNSEAGGARSILKNPASWRSFYREVQKLRQEISETGKTLAAAQETREALHESAWSLALEARAVNQRLDEVHIDYDLLLSKNFSGPLLNSALREIEHNQARIAAIPLYFLSGDKSEVVQGGDKAAVMDAHKTLEEISSSLDELSYKAQGWEQQYQQMQAAIARMGADIGELDGMIGDMPPGLQLSQEKAQYESSRVVSQNLAASAAHTQIEKMEAIAKEADRISRSGRELSARLGKARRESKHLALAIEATSTQLDAVSEIMGGLATRKIYPLSWGESGAKLSDCKTQADQVGGLIKERTIGDIHQDLIKCAGLKADLDALSEHIQALQSEHIKLEKIFAGTEYQNVEPWLALAHQTAAESGEFAPENWPRSEGISSLQADLLALEKEMLRLAPDTIPQPVSETELGVLLEDSFEMDSAFREMRLRITRVAARLKEINEIEETARNLLEGAAGVFNQIRYLIRSNEFLTKIAGKENERYIAELSSLEAGLKDRRSGSGESRLKRVDSALAKMETSTNRWVEQLIEAVDEKIALIKSSLEVLDKELYLDENPVTAARDLVRTGRSATVGETGARGGYPLGEIPAQLKRGNDSWQNACAILGAFQDVESPVLESYREASQYRQDASMLFKDFAKLINRRSNWPPTTVSIKPLKAEFEGLESAWKSLRNEPSRAITLVAKLGGFSTRYQKLAIDLERQTVQAGGEIARVRGLEEQISGLIRKWENLRKSHRDNPGTSQAIRELVDGARAEGEGVKRQFLRGEIDYEQVVLELGGLLSKVRSAQAPVDEDNALNVDGKVIPYS